MKLSDILLLNKSTNDLLNGSGKDISPGGVILLPLLIEDHKINWVRLESTITESIKYLDSLIEIYQLSTSKVRLGISGFADLLMELEIRYGSLESINIIMAVMNILLTKSYEASIILNIDNPSANIYIDPEILDRLPISTKKKIMHFGIKHSGLIGMDINEIPDNKYNKGIAPILFKAYKDINNKYYIHSKFKNILLLGRKKDWCVDIWDILIEDYMNIYAIVKKFSDQHVMDILPVEKIKNLNLQFYLNELGSVKFINNDENIIGISYDEASEYVISVMVENIIRPEDLVDCNCGGV